MTKEELFLSSIFIFVMVAIINVMPQYPVTFLQKWVTGFPKNKNKTIMGKLLDRLQKQLATENKQDAEDCLKIYQYLEETTGHVWESEWNVLANRKLIGQYPYKSVYSLTPMGKTFLKGIENQKPLRDEGITIQTIC